MAFNSPSLKKASLGEKHDTKSFDGMKRRLPADSQVNIECLTLVSC